MRQVRPLCWTLCHMNVMMVALQMKASHEYARKRLPRPQQSRDQREMARGTWVDGKCLASRGSQDSSTTLLDVLMDGIAKVSPVLTDHRWALDGLASPFTAQHVPTAK